MEPAKKIVEAEIITPPNTLKEKIGAGGLDEAVIKKAQVNLENNNIDLQPIAAGFLDRLTQALADYKAGKTDGAAAMEAINNPVMQLKSQGGMFKYGIISEIADILVNFLDTVPELNNDVIDIIVAHKTAMQTILKMQLKNDGGPVGAKLKTELAAACARYYKSRGI